VVATFGALLVLAACAVAVQLAFLPSLQQADLEPSLQVVELGSAQQAFLVAAFVVAVVEAVAGAVCALKVNVVAANANANINFFIVIRF
jgi:hypothetical protein